CFVSKRMGSLCQTAVRTSQSSAGISRQIHPQSGYLQPSDSGNISERHHFFLQGLSSGSPETGNDSRTSGVYQKVFHAYSAQRAGPDQALWNIGKFGQADHYSAYSSGTWSSES